MAAVGTSIDWPGVDAQLSYCQSLAPWAKRYHCCETNICGSDPCEKVDTPIRTQSSRRPHCRRALLCIIGAVGRLVAARQDYQTQNSERQRHSDRDSPSMILAAAGSVPAG